MRKFLIAAAMLAMPGVGHAAAFINGGFESGPATDQFIQVNAPSDAITGWSVGGISVDYIHDYWQAGEGAYSIDLSGNNVGSLFQTFDTRPGKTYEVTYLIAGNPVAGNAIKVLTVGASGNAAQTASFDTTGRTRADMGWQSRTYRFIADRTGSTTLTFATTDATGYGPALDGVTIAAAVPEAATWAMMIAGFGVVGGAMRRRRHVAAFA